MTILPEFISLYVRLSDIDRVFPGGMTAYLNRFNDDLGLTIWHDQHLLREGAMSRTDADCLVRSWVELGLTPYRYEADKPVEWLDICISHSPARRTTFPCAWIAYHERLGGFYLRGKNPGPLAGPYRRDKAASNSDEEFLIPDPLFHTTK